jgi:hypothetical protein
MTKFFITRPIFASVLSIIIVLAGLAAALKLPIAQYPQIAPPTVLQPILVQVLKHYLKRLLRLLKSN